MKTFILKIAGFAVMTGLMAGAYADITAEELALRLSTEIDTQAAAALKGAPVNSQANYDRLMEIYAQGSTEAQKKGVNGFADQKYNTNKSRGTLLVHQAAIAALKTGDATALRFLLKKGADVNKTDKEGNSALHYAVRAAHQTGSQAKDATANDRLMRALLGDVSKKDRTQDDFGTLEWILAYGGNPDLKSKENNNKSAVNLLTELKGLSPEIRNAAAKQLQPFQGKTDIAHAQRRLEQSLGDLHGSESGNFALRGIVDGLRVNVANLTDSLAKITEAKLLLEKEHAALKDAKAKLDTEHSDLKTAKARLDADHAALKTAKANLDKDYASLNKTHVDLKAAKTKLDTEHADLTAAKASLDKDHAELKTAKINLDKDYAALNTAKTNLDKDHADLNKSHVDLKGVKAKLDTDYANLKTAKEMLDADFKTLSKNNAQLDKDHQSLVKNFDTLKTSKEKLDADHLSVTKAKAALETEHKALQTAKGKLDADYKTLSETNGQLQKDHKALQKDYADLKSSKEKLDADHVKLQTAKAKLETDQAALKKVNNALAEENKALKEAKGKSDQSSNTRLLEIWTAQMNSGLCADLLEILAHRPKGGNVAPGKEVETCKDALKNAKGDPQLEQAIFRWERVMHDVCNQVVAKEDRQPFSKEERPRNESSARLTNCAQAFEKATQPGLGKDRSPMHQLMTAATAALAELPAGGTPVRPMPPAQACVPVPRQDQLAHGPARATVEPRPTL